MSRSVGDITIAATGGATVSGALSATFDPVVVSATGAVAVSASLNATVGPITASGTGTVVVSGVASAMLDDFALAAEAAVTAAAPARSLGGGLATFPWWWSAYVARITAEKAAEREAKARTGTVFAVAPGPFADARAEHANPPLGMGRAVAPALTAHGEGTVPQLLLVVDHIGPADDEALALLGAALLLAA